ncbi:MAG: hypothetical protein ACE5LB_15025 [Acidiferrobacterales bacterium]
MQKLAFAFLLVLATIVTTFAHEGHAHPDEGLSLWQIVAVVAAAVVTYLAVNTMRKRRERRRKSRDSDATDEPD